MIFVPSKQPLTTTEAQQFIITILIQDNELQIAILNAQDSMC